MDQKHYKYLMEDMQDKEKRLYSSTYELMKLLVNSTEEVKLNIMLRGKLLRSDMNRLCSIIDDITNPSSGVDMDKFDVKTKIAVYDLLIKYNKFMMSNEVDTNFSTYINRDLDKIQEKINSIRYSSNLYNLLPSAKIVGGGIISGAYFASSYIQVMGMNLSSFFKLYQEVYITLIDSFASHPGATLTFLQSEGGNRLLHDCIENAVAGPSYFLLDKIDLVSNFIPVKKEFLAGLVINYLSGYVFDNSKSLDSITDMFAHSLYLIGNNSSSSGSLFEKIDVPIKLGNEDVYQPTTLNFTINKEFYEHFVYPIQNQTSSEIKKYIKSDEFLSSFVTSLKSIKKQVNSTILTMHNTVDSIKKGEVILANKIVEPTGIMSYMFNKASGYVPALFNKAITRTQDESNVQNVIVQKKLKDTLEQLNYASSNAGNYIIYDAINNSSLKNIIDTMFTVLSLFVGAICYIIFIVYSYIKLLYKKSKFIRATSRLKDTSGYRFTSTGSRKGSLRKVGSRKVGRAGSKRAVSRRAGSRRAGSRRAVGSRRVGSRRTRK